MKNAIIAGLVTFLTILGCFAVYQRETTMLQNQQVAFQALQQQNGRLQAVEQFLQQQIQMSQRRAPAPQEAKR